MTEQLHIDKFLHKIKFLFSYTGLTLESRKRTKAETLISRCLYIFNFLWLNTDILGEILWLIDGIRNGESFIDISFIIPCVGISLLSNLQSMTHVLQEDIINQIIEELRELERKEKDHNKNSKELENVQRNEIINEETKICNFAVTAQSVCIFFTSVIFCLSPFMMMAIKYFKTNELELFLPFFTFLPFDVKTNTRNWAIMYVHQMWSSIMVVSNVTAFVSIFYIFCSFIHIHFRLLKFNFERIISDGDGSEIISFENNDFRCKLINLIECHQGIIRIVNLFEVISSKIILYYFTTSSMLICLAGFNITTSNDMLILSSFVVYLLMALTQIFLLCYFGDMIVSSSMEVSDAIYNSHWTLAEPKTAKLLLLIQIRAQKPCKLTAAGYADLNLQAFTKVLSTAWSYFALLNTMYSTDIQ